MSDDSWTVAEAKAKFSDTNLVSEWAKPRPDAGVAAWLAEADEDRVFLSVMTLAELRYGIERMAAGNRRRRLDQWLREALPLRFAGRILPIDGATADAWGKIAARSEAPGRPLGVADAFLAATVEVRGLTLVTRNAADFAPVLTAIVNPWTAGRSRCERGQEQAQPKSVTRRRGSPSK